MGTTTARCGGGGPLRLFRLVVAACLMLYAGGCGASEPSSADPAIPTPYPPLMPTNFTAAFLLVRHDMGSQPVTWAGQLFYSSEFLKLRQDVTASEDQTITSTFSYYGFEAQYIYTYSNAVPPSCFSFSVDKSSYPLPNWLSLATYQGTAQVLGRQTAHWRGEGGPRFGPSIGSASWDCYLAPASALSGKEEGEKAGRVVQVPVLVSNDMFEMYFFSVAPGKVTPLTFQLPSICPSDPIHLMTTNDDVLVGGGGGGSPPLSSPFSSSPAAPPR
ncbi:hypothetical protein QOT17_001722 [Balamuthia mandrillaris]